MTVPQVIPEVRFKGEAATKLKKGKCTKRVVFDAFVNVFTLNKFKRTRKFTLSQQSKILFLMLQSPPWRATEIQRRGGSKRWPFPSRWGWLLEVFFTGGWSKIGGLLETNSCSVEQAISYFTVNQCFKAEIWIFFRTTQLIRISWSKFWGLVLKSDNLPPF